jgi:hypothetical protein
MIVATGKIMVFYALSGGVLTIDNAEFYPHQTNKEKAFVT